MNRENTSITELVRKARAHAANAERSEAASCCQAILQRSPDHRFALSLLANLAMRSERWSDATELCRRAVAVAPDDAVLRLNLAMTLMRTGDQSAALIALRDATVRNPKLAIAHLYAGALLKQAGDQAGAVDAWCDAFSADPELRGAYLKPDCSDEIRQLSQAANAALRDEHMARHQAAVAGFRAQMDGSAQQRFDAFLAHFHGCKTLPWEHDMQRPSFMYYPGLAPRAWYQREEFDWVTDFEAAAPAILEEWGNVMQAGTDLEPYLDHVASAPPQMQQLKGSSQWSSYHLLARGRPVEAHCQVCPRSYAAVSALPLPVGEDQSPEAFYSILKADTHIPPHFGVSNTKIVVHLALQIPSRCALRAGTETREWQPGQCLIFDDSFEHEAWNRSQETRAVLITEVWNPALTGAERDALAEMLRVTASWHRFVERSPQQAS